MVAVTITFSNITLLFGTIDDGLPWRPFSMYARILAMVYIVQASVFLPVVLTFQQDIHFLGAFSRLLTFIITFTSLQLQKDEILNYSPATTAAYIHQQIRFQSRAHPTAASTSVAVSRVSRQLQEGHSGDDDDEFGDDIEKRQDRRTGSAEQQPELSSPGRQQQVAAVSSDKRSLFSKGSRSPVAGGHGHRLPSSIPEEESGQMSSSTGNHTKHYDQHHLHPNRGSKEVGGGVKGGRAEVTDMEEEKASPSPLSIVRISGSRATSARSDEEESIGEFEYGGGDGDDGDIPSPAVLYEEMHGKWKSFQKYLIIQFLTSFVYYSYTLGQKYVVSSYVSAIMSLALSIFAVIMRKVIQKATVNVHKDMAFLLSGLWIYNLNALYLVFNSPQGGGTDSPTAEDSYDPRRLTSFLAIGLVPLSDILLAAMKQSEAWYRFRCWSRVWAKTTFTKCSGLKGYYEAWPLEIVSPLFPFMMIDSMHFVSIYLLRLLRFYCFFIYLFVFLFHFSPALFFGSLPHSIYLHPSFSQDMDFDGRGVTNAHPDYRRSKVRSFCM